MWTKSQQNFDCSTRVKYAISNFHSIYPTWITFTHIRKNNIDATVINITLSLKISSLMMHLLLLLLLSLIAFQKVGVVLGFQMLSFGRHASHLRMHSKTNSDKLDGKGFANLFLPWRALKYQKLLWLDLLLTQLLHQLQFKMHWIQNVWIRGKANWPGQIRQMQPKAAHPPTRL